MQDYICSFEQYGECGLEQSVADTTDWKIVTAGQASSNGPALDNTLRSSNGIQCIRMQI